LGGLIALSLNISLSNFSLKITRLFRLTYGFLPARNGSGGKWSIVILALIPMLKYLVRL
jgi:hypothetical protein